MSGIFGMIDPTVTLGNLIEIASIIGGGLLVLIRLNNNVVSLKIDVGGMQVEIKKLGDILIAQANLRGELQGITTRLNTAESDIRDLRHGDGFIRGPRGVDKEYL